MYYASLIGGCSWLFGEQCLLSTVSVACVCVCVIELVRCAALWVANSVITELCVCVCAHV